MKISLLILASGEGTNAENIMSFASEYSEKFIVKAMISNRKNSGAFEKAKKYGVPALYIPHEEEEILLEKLQELQPDWACLAGYMRIVGPKFLQFFYDDIKKQTRVLNIHPSYLPQFPGLYAYEQAFQANVKESGVTVHFVDEKIDHGSILIQEKFPRYPSDDFAAFKARGKSLEHKLYRKALESIGEAYGTY